MMMNCTTNKYCEPAECYYNDYNGSWCLVGTTISTDGIKTLLDMFDSPDLLTEIEMPAYVTDDYDGAAW